MNLILKIRNKIISNKILLLSFFIPFFVFLLVFTYFDVFLSNEKMIALSDMYAQYLSFFGYLKDVFNGTQNIFYSFEKGLGGNMIGAIAYYLSSPINLLLFFFSKLNIYHMMSLIIGLKISLSGLTMYLYLKQHFKEAGNISLLIFSSSYALMAYNVTYYYHVMWLDGVFLAPLVMIGIDRILKGKSSFLYILTLFLSILSNFYIGFMICIFSVFYFIYNYFLGEKLTIKPITDFAFSSIFGGLLSSFMLLPVLAELSATSKMSNNIFATNKLSINLNIFDIFSKFVIASQNYNNILNNWSVNIYTGVFVLVLVILYFLNSKISKKEKLFTSFIFTSFVLSVLVNYFNYIWHGFNQPISFNFRFSFLYSMFFIIIALKSFIKLDKPDLKKYCLVGIIIAGMILPINFFKYIYISKYLIFVTIALSFMYLFLLYILNENKYSESKRNTLLLIFVLVMAELTFNFYISLKDYDFKNKSEYEDFVNIFGEKINNIKNIESSKFYRIEKIKPLTQNDSFLLGYNGVNSFLSTANLKVVNFFNNNGYTAPDNAVFYQNLNPIVDSILGVKYVIYSDNLGLYYKKIDSFDFSKYSGILYNYEMQKFDIAINEKALSLGFMVDEDAKNFEKLFIESGNYDKLVFSDFILQNMLGDYSESIMSKAQVNKKDKYNYTLTVDKSDNIFGYIYVALRDAKDTVTLYLNNSQIYETNYMSNGFFTLKNSSLPGEKNDYNVKIVENGSSKFIMDPTFYYFNYDVYEKKIDLLSKNQLFIVENKGNYIKGEVTATMEKPVLFTSIPFEKGWETYVDGKKAKPMEIYSTFIGLELSPGNHVIEFRFSPPRVKLGLVISAISLFGLILYIKYKRSLLEFVDKTFNRYNEIIRYIIVGVLTTLISISTYALFARLIGFNYLVSSIISWIFAILFAYFSNKIFVFKSNNRILTELINFVGYRVLSLFIDILIMFILVEILKIDDLVSKVLVQFIVLALNYIFSKIFIFKN